MSNQVRKNSRKNPGTRYTMILCTLLHLAGWELRSFPAMIGVIQPFQPQQTVDTKYMKDMKDSTKDQCISCVFTVFLLFLCVAFWFKTHFRAWQRNLLVPMELRGLSHTVSVRFQFSVSWAAAPVVSCGILWYPVSCARAGSADSFSKAHQYRQM